LPGTTSILFKWTKGIQQFWEQRDICISSRITLGYSAVVLHP